MIYLFDFKKDTLSLPRNVSVQLSGNGGMEEMEKMAASYSGYRHNTNYKIHKKGSTSAVGINIRIQPFRYLGLLLLGYCGIDPLPEYQMELPS